MRSVHHGPLGQFGDDHVRSRSRLVNLQPDVSAVFVVDDVHSPRRDIQFGNSTKNRSEISLCKDENQRGSSKHKMKTITKRGGVSIVLLVGMTVMVTILTGVFAAAVTS